MKFTMTIDSSNAAFSEYHDRIHELGNAFHDIERKILDGHANGKVRDINGNTVGEWSLTLDEEEK